MASEQHAQAETQATTLESIFEEYRASYAPAQTTLITRLKHLYDTFITPLEQKANHGEWTDFTRGFARRALAGPSRAIDRALEAHVHAVSSRELADLRDRPPAPQQKKLLDAYAHNVGRLVTLATRNAYARLKRRLERHKPSAQADAVASEDTADSSISRSPSPLCTRGSSKRTRSASAAAEHPHAPKRDGQDPNMSDVELDQVSWT